MTLALAIWFRSIHLLPNIGRAYINETEMNRAGLLTDSGLFAKLCTYNTESSHIRLNNAYVKMTENMKVVKSSMQTPPSCWKESTAYSLYLIQMEMSMEQEG